MNIFVSQIKKKKLTSLNNNNKMKKNKINKFRIIKI